MKRKTEEAIMAASKPSDIFSMNPDTIEQEKDEYLEAFKPQPYSSIRNFIVSQKVILLYREALNKLSDKNSSCIFNSLLITEKNGHSQEYDYQYSSDIKIGMMYVTNDNIIFVLNPDKKAYYDNYISKTTNIPIIDKKIWSQTEYMFPKVSKNFESMEGNWVIIVDKPCQIYPLREILNYFDGKIKPEYVASILTKLYYFESTLDLIGMIHNGITIDNLFFAPGRKLEKDEEFTVDDMRIVGVYGGWFFSTNKNEKLKGVPKDVYEILPKLTKQSNTSSFKVDALSIKRVARELLGDSSGKNLEDVPEAFVLWVNNSKIEQNPYKEYCSWEKVIIRSFGKRRFVQMDVSID